MPPNVPNIDILEQTDQQEVGSSLACSAEQQATIAMQSLPC